MESDEPKGRAKGGLARAAKLTAEERKQIAKQAALSRWQKEKEGAMLKDNDNNMLLAINNPKGAVSAKQLTLDLGIEIERDINGIEMGVLENGIAFLSERGLERIVGVTRKKLYDIANEWEEAYKSNIWSKGRINFIQDRLHEDGFNEPTLYIKIKKNNVIHHAYPDIVCMAILEYYAYEAQTPIDTAVTNFRKFARYGLQKFIYEAVGYKPSDSWKYFHDRTSILNDAAPTGYFIVYNETTGLIVDLINSNLTVNDKTIPDLSVGKSWASYWKANDFDNKYGDRVQYEHNYPDYYPQATSNPQPAWAYPDKAIPEFRKWFREEYLTTKFPIYILNKANTLRGGKEEAKRIAEMYKPKQLEG